MRYPDATPRNMNPSPWGSPMPRKALTEQGVERLRPPKSNRAEINDKTVPGLVFRVTPRGVKSWSVLYRIAGAGGMNRGRGRYER